jgi:hypothetical protein
MRSTGNIKLVQRVSYRGGIHATSFMRRQREPNRDYYPTAWRDNAQRCLRQQGHDDMPMSLLAFIVGTIANGVTFGPLDQPRYTELGFSAGEGLRPIIKWRDVLETSELPKPVESKTRRPVETVNLQMVKASVA